jgi:hypothetical protein
VIKTAWYWHKNRHKDQRNRIEVPDTDLWRYRHLIFKKKNPKNMCWRKDILFNKWCSENWISTCRRLKLDLGLSTCSSVISKWMKDLNVRPKTVKLL